MSFRTRLISFFVVIVLAPMLAVGVLVLRLINDSSQSQNQARVNGLLAAATSVYSSEEAAAQGAATSFARNAADISQRQLRARLHGVLAQAGLVRVQLVRDGRVILDVGSRSAVAPGTAAYRQGRVLTMVRVASITAEQLANDVGLGNGLLVREGSRILASNLPGLSSAPARGNVRVGHLVYVAASSGRLAGFSGAVRLTALSNIRSGASVGSSRALALVFLVGFLILALGFAVIASRGLQSQLNAFLRAARRLAGGDFSAPVPVQGRDEFSMLAREFNRMSGQLAERLEELRTERARLRESIRRSGEAFASNLDHEGLLKLAMKTAVDAVEAEFGRLSLREQVGDPLVEAARESSLAEAAQAVGEAEQRMLETHELAQAEAEGVFVAAAPLGEPGGYPRGVLTVGRRSRPFPAPDLDLLSSLAWQASVALENVELHEEVQRQAVTDKLTGLTNHGRFQEVLGTEIEQVRRYRYPVGLIMLDIDNFKQVNDTYGHPQGDQVLQAVARVLREESREADWAARYGGEEMALILPHTDLEGAYVIAERVRAAVADLRIPVLGADGLIEVTASLGVASTTDPDKRALIAEADSALYQAKREGKNRTIRATPIPANVAGGE